MNTKQTGNNASNQNAQGSNKSSSNNQQSGAPGAQGGTHEQHVEAGRQSHKNSAANPAAGNQQSGQADSKQAERNQSGTKATVGTRGGSPEQHAEAGRQSHKNR